MMVILTADDMAGFSGSTRNEILARFKSGQATSVPLMAPPPIGKVYDGVDLEDVADLTFKQVQAWMEAASEKTKAGLRVIAELGPVIRAKDLTEAGIENLPHFQSRTTIRTRTVTGDKGAFLLGWDDWSEVGDGEGRYAVTPITHQSLRRFFQLE